MKTSEKILLVEPDFVWQNIMSRHLFGWGLSAHFFPTGRKALSAAADLLPVLAVVELDLPDMDGFFLIRQLRRIPILNMLPVIVITQNQQRIAVETALENSVNEFLIKSEHDPDFIAKRIASYVGYN